MWHRALQHGQKKLAQAVVSSSTASWWETLLDTFHNCSCSFCLQIFKAWCWNRVCTINLSLLSNHCLLLLILLCREQSPSRAGATQDSLDISSTQTSGAIPAPEESWQTSAGQGRALWGSPAALLPRWCSCRNKCPPFQSSTVCLRTKCQWAFQIKTLKMYEQQLSHTRKLITVGELFLLRSGQAVFNITVLIPSYSANKLNTRKTH